MYKWRCAGCGIEGEDTMRRCHCATNIVTRKNEDGSKPDQGAWKTDPPCPHCGKPIDHFGEPETDE